MFSAREVPDYNEVVIMAEMINEDGGITVNGQQYEVELVLEDTKSTVDGVTAAVNKLVYDEGIKFIIGPTAFFAPAATPICEANHVLRMITWDVRTPGSVDNSTAYAFLGGSGSLQTSIALAQYIKETYPDMRTVAVPSPDDGQTSYVNSIVDNMLLTVDNITVVGDWILYSNEMEDFSPIVSQLNSMDVSGYFMQCGLVPHIGSIVKGLRELGNNKPYAGSLPARMSQVKAIAGDVSLDDVFTVAYTPGDPSMESVGAELISRVTTKYGADYQLELTAANCLWILKEAIEAAQSLDPTVVKNKLESMDEIDTIFGSATICGEVTCGIKHIVATPQPIQIWEDGAEACAGWFSTYLP
jgi:branched-chain amino acid transport system substrate-binding protein